MVKKTPKEKVYIVLGMRSASSLIAKALHDQGIDMGSGFIKGTKTGQKTYEDAEIVAFNKKILKSFRSSWDNFNVTFKQLLAIGNLFPSSFFKKPTKWGFKDPRTCITLPAFLKRLIKERDVYLICCFRRPRYVANSFKRIHNFSEKKAIKLAKKYNKRVLQNIKLFLEMEEFET